MFQLLHTTEVKVISVTNRLEKHGDEDRKAVSIGLELTDANTSLDVIDPKIREALYKAVEGQGQLPGVEPGTPVLRCNAFEKHTLSIAYEGWTLTVEDGVDEADQMVFGAVKADKFTIEAKQGGSVVLRFRVGTSDVDAKKLGKLAMHNGEAIWITLIAPKPGAAPIDGTQDAFDADHPEAADLVSKAHGGPEEEDDSEGGHPDADRDAGATGDPGDGPWPFPRDHADAEAPPQSVTTERSPRTARGRAATKSAPEAGSA